MKTKKKRSLTKTIVRLYIAFKLLNIVARHTATESE